MVINSNYRIPSLFELTWALIFTLVAVGVFGVFVEPPGDDLVPLLIYLLLVIRSSLLSLKRKTLELLASDY